MDSKDVKAVLDAYVELEKRAEKVLIAGDIRFGEICSVVLDDDEVSINYCVNCRGENFYEYENVPVEMLADGIDLKAEWQKIKEARKKKQKRAQAAARRAEARALKQKELAELKRLKAKYPDV